MLIAHKTLEVRLLAKEWIGIGSILSMTQLALYDYIAFSF
jgi:hypothetical protein